MKKKILQYSITFGVCTLLTFAYIAIGGIFSLNEIKETLKLLVDGFFSIGIISLCFGLLVICSNNGAYDLIVYGFVRFASLFRKDSNAIKYHTYFDYHTAKQEEEDRSFDYFLIVGGFFILVSLIILIFWYKY